MKEGGGGRRCFDVLLLCGVVQCVVFVCCSVVCCFCVLQCGVLFLFVAVWCLFVVFRVSCVMFPCIVCCFYDFLVFFVSIVYIIAEL